MTIPFNITQAEDGKQEVFAWIDGKSFVANRDHPNFSEICEVLLHGSEAEMPDLASLFNIALSVGMKFQRLTTRVTATNNRIFYDGAEMRGELVDAILRALNEENGSSLRNVDHYEPLAKFFEKVMDNPDEHSRENLWRWLANNDFSISENGNILGFKGVGADWKSSSSGKAIVDSEVIEGRIPNHVGALVEMPRSEVTHDPSSSCSVGLHVGTKEYARSYANPYMLLVEVDPHDVVSVPTDCGGQKMRVCRYVVVANVESDGVTPILPKVEPVVSAASGAAHDGDTEPAKATAKSKHDKRDDKIRADHAKGVSARKLIAKYHVGARKLRKILAGGA